MQTAFGIIAAVLVVVSAIPYLKDVLCGKTKLEQGSYTIWLALPITALITQMVSGVSTASLYFAIGDTLIALIFFVLMFKYGYGGVVRRDIFALLVAALGLGLWVFTREPLVALVVTICIDAIGAILVAIKAVEAPQTETTISWALYLVASCLAIAAADVSLLTLLYPIYAAISSIVILICQQVGFYKSKIKK